jgi:ribitol-5-phosphate 2-dehydrogenase (NADP+) / D-ribitol-5-phosphate cytidylyltransferase
LERGRSGEEPQELDGISAVILAGGIGRRFGSTVPKPFIKLNGKPVIQYSIDVIEPYVDEIIVVAAHPYRHYKFAPAGRTRQESTLNGLLKCNSPRHVIVHDAVRPLITEKNIYRVKYALENGAICVSSAVPIIDGFITRGTPQSKEFKMLAQTPEGFDYQTLLDALQKADKVYQDCPSLLYEEYNIYPTIVEGVHLNSKLTFARDLENAEGILRFSEQLVPCNPNLRGKRFLVLGGSGGIGRACVKQLLACGANVEAPTHSELDLSHSQYIDLEGFDGVIYAAGTDVGNIMLVNALNCYGLLTAARASSWKGNIVFLSSTAATLGRPGTALYSASKAALNSIIESEHEDLAKLGIIINAIAPAKVNTPMAHRMHGPLPAAELLNPNFVAEHVLRFLDTDVHGRIVYLRVGM